MSDVTGRAPLEMSCVELPDFDRADPDDVASAFRNQTAVALRQAWLPQPSPALTPGTVRMGWREDALFVFADLVDADTFTRATDHNQRFWELGDTFEIFLRPPGQDAYVELHVAPGNLRLHLRFADAAWLTRDPFVDPFVTSLAPADLFRSRVWMSSDSARWCLLAEVPAGSVCHVPAPLPGSTWAFSFGRYDYTRGAGEPVLSSSSPHAIAAFHRQHEWGAVRFAGASAPVGQRRRDASFGH